MSLFIPPWARAPDANNRPMPGATLAFYASGTLDLVDVFTTAERDTAHDNPLTAGGGGLFPPVYLDPSIIYRVVLTPPDAEDPTQDIDPYNEGYLLTGGVTRTFVDKMADTVSLLDFIPVSLHADIRARISTVDVTSYVQAGIDYLDNLTGGTLYIPEGLYTITGTVNLCQNLVLQGAGRKSSVFRFTGTGTAFASTWTINSSTIANIMLRDFGVVATTTTSLPLSSQPSSNGSNVGHGIYEQGGAYVCVYNVWVYGFRYGITFNQTELAEIDLCLLEFQGRTNVWLVNTAGLLGTEAQGFTNRICVSRCQLNSGGSYNIVDDGGVDHVYMYNNYNGAGIYHLRIAGVTDVNVISGEFEAATDACIYLDSMSAGIGTATTGVGQCAAVLIQSGHYLCPVGKPALLINGADHITLVANFFSYPGDVAIARIQGMNNVNKLTEIGSSFETGILFDTAGGSTSRVRSETAVINGSATYDPGSLAAGAKTAIQTMTITGVDLGDPVEHVSFTVDLAGARIHAWVSATNTLSYYFVNENGADPLDLASGTVFAEVRRRHF